MKLLIPGPVTTHPDVRAALAQDIAPWDNDFRPVYAGILARVLTIAGGRPETHAALALQGCGHFIVEAALRSFVPAGGRILIPTCGAYADRMTRLAREAGREPVALAVPGDRRLRPEEISAALAADPSITHVGLIYSETGTGVVHDVPALAAAAGALGRRVLVDAVSAFGAMPYDAQALPMVDAAMFTSNKCIEGVPGLAFAICPLDRLEGRAGQAGSWSFDLPDIHAMQKRSPGSFRFTPPAQVIAAFARALDLYEAEGQEARRARYTANMRTLYDGVRALGLSPCLPPEEQGPVIVNVHAPEDPHWDLQKFVDALKRRGILISNFYNTPFPSFRIGCIGALTPDDMRMAVQAIGEAMGEIGVDLRRNAHAA
jgi:2-aminoethylphosphonate-pyruvate transaminase